MNQYQKVYMNQIHSSSLLGQLAQMWRSQMLCDALIRTGNVTTKAHRVVLVAACPMLQSMDNASVGSHLEVRLAADIKQEAVNSFLQYLYEGFMMLSEENCKDVEKVARLLQVDSVTKCCIDFYNCLQKKTGVPVYSNTQYKYSSADLLEFRHVRTTDLQKTIHERMMKRAAADSMRPMSPGGKRQRTQQRPPSPNIDLAMFGQKADDTLSMAHSYMGNQGADPWERVPRLGAVHGQRTQQPKPGVIEIVEDSLEILQTQPPDKDGNKSAPPVVQKSLAISVSSQINQSSDVHIVNVNDTSSHSTAATDGPIMSTGRDSITVSPLTVMPGSSSSSISSPLTKDQHKPSYDSQKEMSDRGQFAKKSVEHQSSTPQQRLFPISMSPANMSPISQVSQPKKSFAAGSASQAANMSQSHESSSVNKRPSSSAGSEIVDRPPSSDSGKDLGAKGKSDDGSASNSTDMAPDLSIVKVEPTIDDPGLDMYVDVPDESMIQAHQRDREHDDESDLEVEEASGDWSRDDMSNETGGNDQNNSWYIGQFKDYNQDDEPSSGTYQLPVSTETYQFPESSRVYQTRDFRVYQSPAYTGVYRPSETTDLYQHRRAEPIATVRSLQGFMRRHKRVKIKQKPGRKKQIVRLMFYLLPDGAEVPKFTKKDPVIQTHQDQGYGYPSIYYADFIGKSHRMSISATEEELRQQIRSLYHKLTDKDFKLFTVDSKKRLIPAPFKPSYYIKYQGRIIIKEEKDTTADVKTEHTTPEVESLEQSQC